MKAPIVIALGGNAISPSNEVDTIDNQFAHTRATADRLADLCEQGWDSMVITHGNGPQVGNVLKRVELARDVAPVLPLQICVADTQGGMGYMIQQCVENALNARGIVRMVATVVTQVEVDPADPGFAAPSKPIGPDRRLVASPMPLRVVEADVIAAMLAAGIIVIAAGGGGVPVVQTPDGLRGVEAVVDKDRTSALLAIAVKATRFLILTDVDGVVLDHGTAHAKPIASATASEMRAFLSEGRFPTGSMGPKVEAACHFVESTGEMAVIAALDDLVAASTGQAGTSIVP